MSPRTRAALVLAAAALPLLSGWAATRPQDLVRLRLTVLLAIKRHAHRQADTWRQVADLAATSYNKARL